MDGLGMKYRAIYSIIIAYLYYTLYNISLYNHICLILGVMQQKYKCNGNSLQYSEKEQAHFRIRRPYSRTDLAAA